MLSFGIIGEIYWCIIEFYMMQSNIDIKKLIN